MPPDPPSLRTLALGDLQPAELELMVSEGESLLELKRAIPSDGLGPTVTSFANTLGGWIVLGVDDKTREVVEGGWSPPGTADVLDHVREILRRDVDPLPPFAAKPMEIDGQPVGVIRVYESTDTPHIVRGTGSVYIREPGAKRPIQDHATLIELARRGEEARAGARRRLDETPAVAAVLMERGAEFSDAQDDEILPAARFVARAAPLTVTPRVRDWPLTRAAGDWVLERAEGLIGHFGMGYGRQGPFHESFGRAIAASVLQETGFGARDEGAVIVDSAGVVGVRISRGASRGDNASVQLATMLDGELVRLATFLAETLEAAEAAGRAIAELWLLLPPNTTFYGARRHTPHVIRAVADLTIPATETEVRELAEAWFREVARSVGVVTYEDGDQTESQ